MCRASIMSKDCNALSWTFFGQVFTRAKTSLSLEVMSKVYYMTLKEEVLMVFNRGYTAG